MSDKRPPWVVVVHGGAETIPPQKHNAFRMGCLTAVGAGGAVLAAGGSALEAVEAAIRVLEDDPTFNAGNGSVPQGDGSITMDAAIMDGDTLDVGAVAAIEGVRHPVTIARMMLREPPVLLVAAGARLFAEQRDAELAIGPAAAKSADGKQERHDTVGCVALDRAGHLASGTSTGGLKGAAPGRVGDAPLPGCGLYADDTRGAVVFSGDGEFMIRLASAAQVMTRIEPDGTQCAVDAAIASVTRLGGEAGAIALDRQGRLGWAHNSTNFAVAFTTGEMAAPRVFLCRSEMGAIND